MSTPTPLDTLKDASDLPDNKWGKLLGATPVIMTVVATLLAGLASSEMTKAQYERAYAAQLQSRAGDQWAFFQAKRLRGEMQRNTLDILAGQDAHPDVRVDPPPVPPERAFAPELEAAMEAIAADVPDEEVTPLLEKVSSAMLTEALDAAKADTVAYDEVTEPLLTKIEDGGSVVARLRFNGIRYDHEARLNAVVGRLYEVQVRKSNLTAVRHHARSQRFFFGMLCAQMGVIISTLAMAAKKRNLLWSIAAGAGLIAIVFAVYVYLYI